jgi:hypothetical protein
MSSPIVVVSVLTALDALSGPAQPDAGISCLELRIVLMFSAIPYFL